MMLKNKISIILVTFIITATIAGCAPYRINLHYKPRQKFGRLKPKYQGFTVGVFIIKDERPFKFYKNEDNFFDGPLATILTNTLVSELFYSGIFSRVIKIDEPLPECLTNRVLSDIGAKYGVDFIVSIRLVDYNLYSYPTKRPKGDKLNVLSKLVMEIYYAKQGILVFADEVNSRAVKFQPHKTKLNAKFVESLTRDTIQRDIAKLLQLINTTGLEVKSRKGK